MRTRRKRTGRAEDPQTQKPLIQAGALPLESIEVCAPRVAPALGPSYPEGPGVAVRATPWQRRSMTFIFVCEVTRRIGGAGQG